MEAVAPSQVPSACGLQEGGSCGSGEKWMDEGMTELPVLMDVG